VGNADVTRHADAQTAQTWAPIIVRTYSRLFAGGTTVSATRGNTYSLDLTRRIMIDLRLLTTLCRCIVFNA
jgi:hypothetical protein